MTKLGYRKKAPALSQSTASNDKNHNIDVFEVLLPNLQGMYPDSYPL